MLKKLWVRLTGRAARALGRRDASGGCEEGGLPSERPGLGAVSHCGKGYRIDQPGLPMEIPGVLGSMESMIP